MDKLIFSSALEQRLISITARIVSIVDLCKELNPAYNHNTNGPGVHTQEILSIL